MSKQLIVNWRFLIEDVFFVLKGLNLNLINSQIKNENTQIRGMTL